VCVCVCSGVAGELLSFAEATALAHLGVTRVFTHAKRSEMHDQKLLYFKHGYSLVEHHDHDHDQDQDQDEDKDKDKEGGQLEKKDTVLLTNSLV